MTDFTKINPREDLTYMTPPNAVVLVSTVNQAGTPNLAPFGYATVVADDPATLLISIHKNSETWQNIQATGTFVAAYLPPEHVAAVYAAGDKIPPEINDFDYTGLTPQSAQAVPAPLVAEAEVNLELKFLGNQPVGTQQVVLGEVVAAHLIPQIAQISGKERRKRVSGLYFTTGGHYFTPGEPPKNPARPA